MIKACGSLEGRNRQVKGGKQRSKNVTYITTKSRIAYRGAGGGIELPTL